MKTKLCLFTLLLLSATINYAVAPATIVHDVAGNQIKANMLANQIADTQERLDYLTKTTAFMQNSKEFKETVQLMQSTICSFEGLGLLLERTRLIGLNNCMFDFEIQAISLRIKNSAWVVTTAMLAWEKSHSLDKSKSVADALEAFSKAHKELNELKEKMSFFINSIENQRAAITNDFDFLSL
jgi:hypothetical protein